MGPCGELSGPPMGRLRTNIATKYTSHYRVCQIIAYNYMVTIIEHGTAAYY